MADFSVMFVCMGNICRSPAGEGILQRMLSAEGMGSRVFVDSSGTIAFHAGEPADARMRQFASKRGYSLNSTARQIRSSDFERFNLILTMDKENYENVLRLDGAVKYSSKIRNFCDYCMKHADKEVPDPYYGGDAGFEHVLDLVEDGCTELVKIIKAKLGA